MISMHQVVRVIRNVPSLKVTRGMVGTVIEVFEVPTRAFEVEFVDAEGRPVAQATLAENDLEALTNGVPDGGTLMNWSVYADMSRPLTDAERQSVFDALDEVVPGSGCVGPRKGDIDEVYFRVEAASSEEASVTAARLLDVILEKTGVQARYEIQLQLAP